MAVIPNEDNGELDISDLEGYYLTCWCAGKPCRADVVLEVDNE